MNCYDKYVYFAYLHFFSVILSYKQAWMSLGFGFQLQCHILTKKIECSAKYRIFVSPDYLNEDKTSNF